MESLNSSSAQVDTDNSGTPSRVETLMVTETDSNINVDGIQQIIVADDDSIKEQGVLVIGDHALSVTRLLSCGEDITVPLGAIIVQSQRGEPVSVYGQSAVISCEPGLLQQTDKTLHHVLQISSGEVISQGLVETIGSLIETPGFIPIGKSHGDIGSKSSGVTVALVSEDDKAKAAKLNTSPEVTENKSMTLTTEKADVSRCVARRTPASKTTDSTKTVNKKVFQCDLCSASFNRQGNYNRHRMIHTVRLKDDYRYKCDTCGKQFLQRCDLVRHAATHTGTEPYRCEICKRGYIRASDLRVHMRFHFKQRTFKCEHCEKSFVQSGDLNRHVRSVHMKTKMLGCGHCLKKFAKEVTLLRHMQTAHWEIIMKSIDGKETAEPKQSDCDQVA